jgi:hypothetical protein
MNVSMIVFLAGSRIKEEGRGIVIENMCGTG